MAAPQEAAQAAVKQPASAQAERPAGDIKVETWKRIQSRIGVSCIMIGLVTYSVSSWAAHKMFYDPAVNAVWRDVVPVALYDRATFVFGTALLVDILNALFEVKTAKLDFVLLPAFIKWNVVLTNFMLRQGHSPILQTATGHFVMVQRYICWMHTTPTMLVLVALISSSITQKQTLRTLGWNACCLVTGLAAGLVTGPLSVILAVISHMAVIPVLLFMHKGLTEASHVMAASALPYTATMAYYVIMLMWINFGAVWDLGRLAAISPVQEEVLYLCSDFMAKVLFSNSLMLGCFKGLEARRHEVMRQIEEGNKQTLIDELKKVLEQKSAFMSAVSHELRTPLNGIIGISEGMLSGCCGTLPRSVRRQVYIIRTSGARLLALINDVMDAAALRQQRLILKQERVPLKPLVDDMLDLTHSLVDPDVQLRNCVPEDFVVWGDSGRVVQILNNLLGNAAKFTARGHITVGAGWRDDSRTQVAIYVLDSGIGVPKHKLSSIFLPFEQVDGSISRTYGGFGLGLSIVQELVRAHGGDITVRSRVNSGSCFTFTLPAYTNQQVTSVPTQKRGAGRSLSAAAANAAPSAPAAVPHMELGAGGRMDEMEPPPSPRQETAAKATRRENALSRLSSMGAGATDGEVIQKHEDVQYDAAQLAALASSKPYSNHSSRRPSVQFVDADMAAKLDALAASSGGSHDKATLRARHTFLTAAASGGGSVAAEGAAAAGAASTGAGASVSSRGSTTGGGVQQLLHKPTWSMQHGKVQILSVDDDNINRSVVESLLDSTGYEVVSARNGRQALAHLASCKAMPDLMLLDVMMPDLSGLEVCAIIRSSYPEQPLPILMVSAASEEASVVKGLDAGADGYITKPFRRQELLARIAALLATVKEETAPSALLPRFLDGNVEVAPAASAAESEERGTFVLCVDDDEIHMRVLHGILVSQEIRVATATSRAEALEFFAPGATPPDMVLLDTSLHDISGVKLLAELRQAYTPLQLPIMIITSRPSEASIVQALEAGANDVVAKPFRRSELMARLRMHLRRSTAHREHATQQQLLEQGMSSVAPSNRRSFAGAPGVALPTPTGMLTGLVEVGGGGGLAGAMSSVLGTLDEGLTVTGPVVEVPVLAAMVTGLEGLMPHQALWQFMAGRLVDAFDTEVEKYAVHKVEMTESMMVVAAPPRVGGSSNDSQPPIQRPRAAGPTNESVVSLAVPDVHGGHGAGKGGGEEEEEGGLNRRVGPCLDLPLGQGVTAVALLMQLGSELLTEFNKTLEAALARFSSPSMTSPPSAGEAQRPQLTADTAAALLGDIKLHVAVHEGELTTAVVGRLRPRFKYYGGAVRGAKEACGGFQVTGLVATPRVGVQLEEAGFKAMMPIAVQHPVHSRSSVDAFSIFAEGGDLDRLFLIDWQRLEEGWGSINPYSRSATWERPEAVAPAEGLILERAQSSEPDPSSPRSHTMASPTIGAAGGVVLPPRRHQEAASGRAGGAACQEGSTITLRAPPKALKRAAATSAAASAPQSSLAAGPNTSSTNSASVEAGVMPQHELLTLQLQLVSMQQQLAALTQRTPAASLPLSHAGSGNLGDQGLVVRSKSATASRPGQLIMDNPSSGSSGQSTPTGQAVRSRLGQLFKKKSSKKKEGVDSSSGSVVGN